jgi:metallo-beta-lactamase class B
LAIAISLAALPVHRAQGPTPDLSSAHAFDSDLRVERIAPGVWRHVSQREMPEYGRVPANGLIVIGEESAALVDTPWTDPQTAQLFDWVERRFGVRIEHVIATHSHGDCMGGLAEAHRRGATSYSGALTAELARSDGNPVPEQTFTDRREIGLGDTDLVLRFLGGGHTRDNIVVWIPRAKVLFGGCLVKRDGGTAGYIAEADLEAWPETLRKVMKAFPQAEVVVPGHGRPGTLEYVDYTIELTEGLAR